MADACACGRKLAPTPARAADTGVSPRVAEITQRLDTIRKRRFTLVSHAGTDAERQATITELRDLADETERLRAELERLHYA
jgi:exonuclease VII large subunit